MAAASSPRASGVSQSGPAGPRPTTTTWPSASATGAGPSPIRLGSTATEKYGTVEGSTSASGAVRSPAMVARSTYCASASRPARSSARRTVGKVRPSFMMTAESVDASRAANSSSGSVPGRMVSTSSASTSGLPSRAAAALTEVTPGTTSVGYRSARRLCMCWYEP